jgi:peroxiredoxin
VKPLVKSEPSAGGPVELEATTYDGHTVSLAALRGGIVIVDFISVFCGYCFEELEAMQQLARARGVAVVTVARGESAETVRAALEARGTTWPFPLIADPEATLLADLPSFGTPTHVVLDAAGRWTHETVAVGADLARLTSAIDRASGRGAQTSRRVIRPVSRNVPAAPR